ncbi:hypothetical protein TeGR_g12364, partial [Tetraparma gracilis]
AKWTIFNEVEETQLCAEFVASNKIEMKLDTADDVVSELSDEPKLSDGTGPSDSDSAKPLVQEGTSGGDNANKPAGLFRRASNFKGGDEFSDKLATLLELLNRRRAQVFDTFDLDKDGVIDETDFGSIVDHLLGGTPPELTKRLYAAFKPDANGKLTKQ